MNLWGQGVSDYGPMGLTENAQRRGIAPASQGICKPPEKPNAEQDSTQRCMDW